MVHGQTPIASSNSALDLDLIFEFGAAGTAQDTAAGGSEAALGRHAGTARDLGLVISQACLFPCPG